MEPNPRFERVVVAAHPQIEEAIEEARQVADFLNARDLRAVWGNLDDPDLRSAIRKNEADLLIALGGDGTMLRSGHLCAPAGLPVLGINLGRFGFLTEIQRDQWLEKLPALLEGRYWIEHRMMLKAERWKDDTHLGTWQVVNETFVGQGRVKRPVRLETFVDGINLTTYVADGLIVSTPTGSTAYALAAGGPILPPDLRNILLVPVAPHLSIDRAVILAEGSSVTIQIESEHESIMSVDGQPPVEMFVGDRVEVCASEYNVSFVRVKEPNYFYDNLTQYLNRHPSLRKR